MKITTVALAVLAPIVAMASCLPDTNAVNFVKRDVDAKDQDEGISTMASGKKGQLFVKLNSASKLTDKDWFGKQNPFIELWLEKSYKSRSGDSRGQNPVYGESFCFYVRPGQSKLHVRAVDADTFSNDKIGETSINLETVMNTGQVSAQDYLLPKWLGFSDNGSINLELQACKAQTWRHVSVQQKYFLPIRFSSSLASHVTRNPVLELQHRGLVANMTSPDLVDHVDAGPTAIYCGVDPTASSLHLGNLVTLLGLLHFHIKGHTTIGLVGGATGSIGDPSGKSTERQPMSTATLAKNVAGIDAQFQQFFKRGRDYAEKRGYSIQGTGGHVKVVNNKTWFGKLSALDFLGDVGRYARVGTMIARDSVKSRLDSPQGISFTEFSYQLLQAYDFWYLYHEDGCRIQLGGSDQWGNITAGIDLIHKKKKTNDEQVVIKSDSDSAEKAPSAYGLTIPLLTTSTGEKFGKSAGNAVWLDETMTSLFDFYQFFVKTSDADVERYLHYFTLLNADEIKSVMKQHDAEPEKRLAQHTLAKETTELVHGAEAVPKALLATHVLFGASLNEIKGHQLVDAFKYDSRLVSLSKSQVSEMSADRFALESGLCASKSEAKKLIKSGGFYINNIKVADPTHHITEKDWIDGAVCVLRSGKSNYKLVKAI
ncbi:tyrosyl-tRNA synthetase [Entomortierella beljakovae]|nr:tyrosyl-tRNA synthetase [Entomortierella beljakovae]